MNKDRITEDQMERVWQELARLHNATVERARREYLIPALEAMTVDNEGNPTPDSAVRQLARQLIDRYHVSMVMVDKSIPPNEVHVRDSKTGKVLGMITNIGPMNGGNK